MATQKVSIDGHVTPPIGKADQLAVLVLGEALKCFLPKVLDAIREYPHGTLGRAESAKRKVLSTRPKKVCCRSCSYTMRVTQKWIDTAIPKCPSPDCELFDEEMEVA